MGSVQVPTLVMLVASAAATFAAGDAGAQYVWENSGAIVIAEDGHRPLTMGGFYAGGAARYPTYRPPPASLYPRYKYAYRDRVLAAPWWRPTFHRGDDPRRGFGTAKPFENVQPAPSVYDRYPSLRRVPVFDRATGQERVIWWIY